MKEVIESTSKLSSVIACHEQGPDVCTCGMASEFQSNEPRDGSDQPDKDEHHAMHRQAVEILQVRNIHCFVDLIQFPHPPLMQLCIPAASQIDHHCFIIIRLFIFHQNLIFDLWYIMFTLDTIKIL